MRGVPLPHLPTAPPAVTFIDIYLPALPRTNRTVTIVVTSRTRKRLCGEIDCRARVPALSQNCVLYEGRCRRNPVPFSIQRSQNSSGAPLVRRLVDQRAAHLGVRLAPAKVAGIPHEHARRR